VDFPSIIIRTDLGGGSPGRVYIHIGRSYRRQGGPVSRSARRRSAAPSRVSGASTGNQRLADPLYHTLTPDGRESWWRSARDRLRPSAATALCTRQVGGSFLTSATLAHKAGALLGGKINVLSGCVPKRT
jgi:hypothetical protein